MDDELLKIYRQLKKKGLTVEQEKNILAELGHEGRHGITYTPTGPDSAENARFMLSPDTVCNFNDFFLLQAMPPPRVPGYVCLHSLDELLERDKQREKDGFPRKIRVGRLIKPGRSGKDKIVVVPTTVEEKFIHDTTFQPADEVPASGGSGKGEEGEVIGEQPVRAPEGAAGEGPGEGQGGPHEMESSAYELGRILSEKFELPNLKDKGKKRSLTRYTYDMTDKHKGFGQFLDKKTTLREIIKTNLGLGNIPDISDIDPAGFLIAPRDRVYRILSREKDYESQAMVFFHARLLRVHGRQSNPACGGAACSDLLLAAVSI